MSEESTARAIIERLRARGMSGEAIGQSIGRDRSLVSQVGRGVKPGDNLRASLAEVERRLNAGEARPVVQPPRRTTTTGRVARVRRPTRVGTAKWGTTSLGKQAVRGGGRAGLAALKQAAENGQDVAVSIKYARSVTVSRSYGRSGVAGRGGVVEVRLDAAEFLDELSSDAGFMDALHAESVGGGFVSATTTTDQIDAVEVRVW